MIIKNFTFFQNDNKSYYKKKLVRLGIKHLAT